MTINRRLGLFAASLLLLMLLCPEYSFCGDETSIDTFTQSRAHVTFGGDTLFSIYSRLGPFTSEERARAISGRLLRLSNRGFVLRDTFITTNTETTTDIMVGDQIIASIVDGDTLSTGMSRSMFAAEAAKKMQLALRQEVSRQSFKSVLTGSLFALLATLVLLILLKGVSILKRKSYNKMESWRGTRIKAIKIQKLEFLSADQITSFIKGGIRLTWVIVIFILFYLYLPIVFSFFPWTRGYAAVIFGYITGPLWGVGHAIIAFLPNAFMIAIISIAAKYLLRFLRFLFDEIGKDKISIPSFYAEWAEPTYKIVRLLVIAFAIVVIFPYLPGSNQPAFKGVSIFVGLLFSLGSASAVANMIAGLVITYMRPFKIGDRVKIADTVGDVIEKSLLVTRIKTIKNEDITIPNGLVLSSHIINYSSSAKELGLILHTSITIGYDAPWKTVHELLISAAENTENILKQPKPFVFQTSLDDFYVTYQINAYTNQPNMMAKIYSDLHQNIQDAFNKAGVEIMSPHYSAIRDGNQFAMPEENIPKNQTPKAFRIWPFDGSSKT